MVPCKMSRIYLDLSLLQLVVNDEYNVNDDNDEYNVNDDANHNHDDDDDPGRRAQASSK